MKGLINGAIYLFYFGLSVNYGLMLTSALNYGCGNDAPDPENRCDKESEKGLLRSDRDSAVNAEIAQRVIRRWFLWGGAGMLLGATYKVSYSL